VTAQALAAAGYQQDAPRRFQALGGAQAPVVTTVVATCYRLRNRPNRDRSGRRGDRMKPARPPRDWRRIHHSPIFWIGVLMCLAAILIYVWSDDLAWR
jgi:hypothetical protein